MSKLTISQAFAKYGAKRNNPYSSVSAEAPDGSLVVSVWEHYFTVKDGKSIYRDRFDRWKGHGNTEFREMVQRAFATNQPLRAVIAHAEKPDRIDAGADASTVRKWYSVKEDWSGRVTGIDGEEFEIEFVRE